MKRSLYTIAIALFGSFVGFHLAVATTHQPVLTGGGATIPNALVFMENAAPANISASSGALSINAGGSNQNITLTPTGSGYVSTPTFVVGNNIGAIGTASATIASTSANSILSIGQSLSNRIRLKWNYNATPGSATFSLGAASSANTLLVQDLGGNTGFNGATGAYPVDVTGDVNASGNFRQGTLVIVDSSQNVKAGGGANTVYRCNTAGAVLPAGSLTITAGACGSTVDTGLRVK